MSTAAIVAGTVGAIGSVASSAIGAHAAGSAASTQANASEQAQQLQAQEAQNALNFNEQQFATTQKNEAPYLAGGGAGLNALQYGLGVGGTANGSGVGQGSLLQPYGQTFTAPTGLTEQNDPGYQARLQLGQDAIQRSAAAKGSVVTGGTAKALDTYSQDYASNEYNNVYNRALNTYDTNYNAYNTNQANQYSKLAGLAGSGQATAANAAQQGQAAANTNSNISLTSGAQQGQDLQNAGAATASGYVGQANALSSGISGLGNSLTNYALLNSMSGYGGGSSYNSQSPYGPNSD